MEDENNKITESEMMVGGFFALGLDGLCALVDLTVVGDAITPVIQGFATFAIDKWIENKGGEPFGFGKQFTQYAVNLLPILPTVTAIFIVRVVIHNNATVAGVAGKVAGKINPAAGVAAKAFKKAA